MLLLACLLAGTKNPKYVLENIAAFDVRLSKEELAELEQAVPRSAVCTVSSVDPSHASMQLCPLEHLCPETSAHMLHVIRKILCPVARHALFPYMP